VVPVTLRMTIDGIDIAPGSPARVVYGNGSRAPAALSELTAAQTAFLRYIVTWRGEAIGAVGTTTLLDAITAGPNAPSSRIRARCPRRRRSKASGRA